jgi:kynurenine formamidase
MATLMQHGVLDLSQDWDADTPAFATHDGPSIKWTKRVGFDRAAAMEITSSLHVGTHLDSPRHFTTSDIGIGEIPLDFLVGPACVVDLCAAGIADFDIFGPEPFEEWERSTGNHILPGDILLVHTGFHRHYPSDWSASCGPADPDETRYFLRHPGPDHRFAEWVLDRKVRWLAVDTGSADHPMNTLLRNVRPDMARRFEAHHGRSIPELFPDEHYQTMHTALFPHGVVHVENMGGQVDQVLDRRLTVGCFPWRFMGGEAAFCRLVAFVDAAEARR